MSETPFAK